MVSLSGSITNEHVRDSEQRPQINDSGFMDTTTQVEPDEDNDVQMGSQEEMDTITKDVWDVNSFDEFCFYCCPECPYRTKTKVSIMYPFKKCRCHDS